MTKMARWVHPHVSLEQMIEYAAAFLELLVLASGLQSNGRPISWTTDNLGKALGWASALEKAMAELPLSADGLESREALDNALAELKASVPALPPGMSRFSVDDLSNAPRILVQALVQAVAPDSSHFDSILKSFKIIDGSEGRLWGIVKDEVHARHSALRSAQALHRFVEAAGQNFLLEKLPSTGSTPIWDKEKLASKRLDVAYGAWGRNALGYMTSLTTTYKVAAASLIFNTGQSQWRGVLDTLHSLPSTTGDGAQVQNATEIVELCCLRLASSNWKEFTSKILDYLCDMKLASVSSRTPIQYNCHRGEDVVASQPEGTDGIEEYVMELLDRQVELWWQLAPMLLAAACTTRLPMLKAYLHTITQAVKGNGYPCKCACHLRTEICNSCHQCSNSLMERLWCFHVLNSHLGALEGVQIDRIWNKLLS